MAKKWRGYGSYGRSALSATLTARGLEKYLQKVKEAGRNIDAAVKEAIAESAKPVYDAMKQGAARHRRTGTVYNAIEVSKVKQEGNFIYANVGVNTGKYPEAMHAVFQEYGDGHSPGFPDPFIRPAFDENINEVRKIQRKVLKKWGSPIE